MLAFCASLKRFFLCFYYVVLSVSFGSGGVPVAGIRYRFVVSMRVGRNVWHDFQAAAIAGFAYAANAASRCWKNVYLGAAIDA